MAETAPGSDTVIPWKSRAMYVILSCSLIGVMGVSMISPILPELRDVFGVSDRRVGLVITAYTLPGVFLSPFVGLVADRLGRRRVVIPLLVVFGVSGTAISFVTEFRSVIALRLLQGIGASGLITMSVTLIGDLYEGPRKDAVLGLNGSVISVGAAVYPFVGGTLAVIRWTVPFLFFSVALGIGVIAVIGLPEPDGVEAMRARPYLGKLLSSLRQPKAVLLYAATFSALFLFYGSVLTAVPLLLSDEFGLGSEVIGPILSVTAGASAVVSSRYGRIARYRRAEELVALGFCAYGVSLIGLWLAPSPVTAAATLLLFGAGNVVALLSIDNTIVTMAPDGLRAGMMGMRTSFFRLGQTVGPVAFTAAPALAFGSDASGYRTAFALAGAFSLAVGVVSYVLLRR
jgi:ACDE family multidrug resistance protein